MGANNVFFTVIGIYRCRNINIVFPSVSGLRISTQIGRARVNRCQMEDGYPSLGSGKVRAPREPMGYGRKFICLSLKKAMGYGVWEVYGPIVLCTNSVTGRCYGLLEVMGYRGYGL